MIKKISIITLIIMLIFGMNTNVKAVSSDANELYQEQVKQSGVDAIYFSLPQETREILEESGITSPDINFSEKLSFSLVISQIKKIAEEKSGDLFTTFSMCIGMLILYSILEGINNTNVSQSLDGVVSSIGTLCVCSSVIFPISKLIEDTAELIKGTSGFMLLYVPIMAGLVANVGYQICASSYYEMLMGIGQALAIISDGIIIPLLNVFLAISITSTFSTGFNFSSVTKGIYQCAKWILSFILGIFVSVLASQTFVNYSLDAISTKTIRFTISSFVPIVGSILSETINEFNGSINLLRSGTGVFIIIVSAYLFIPLLTECILWKISFSVLDVISEVLGITKTKQLFNVFVNMLSMIIAILLSVIVILIISTVIVLLIGR